jgi:hypothetical protein
VAKEAGGEGAGRIIGEANFDQAKEGAVKRPFRLVSTEGRSQDTIACLKAALAEAEAGELIGWAGVLMYRRREWDYQNCGETHRNPTWTAGMLTAFLASLSSHINAH